MSVWQAIIPAGLLACLLCTSASAGTRDVVPGTRMEVDWPRIVSSGDVRLTTPPSDSYQGLLLGSGDVAVSQFGPPELLTLHVGKNDIWDYRDAMDDIHPVAHKDFLAKYADAGKPPVTNYLFDAAVDAHNVKVREAYGLSLYPTSKPAGQIRFRNPRLIGGKYDGALRLWDAGIEVRTGQDQPTLKAFVSYPRNLIVARYDPQGARSFDIELARHQDATGRVPNGPEFGAQGRDLWVRYKFPADPTNYPNGFEYVMYARVIGGDSVKSEAIPDFAEITQGVWYAGQAAIAPIKTREGVAVAHVASAKPVTVLVAVVTSRDDADPLGRARRQVESAQRVGETKLAAEHQAWWHSYWRRSCIDLTGKSFLNGVWYFSQYLLACSWRQGKLAPGLFGAWAWEDCPLFGNDYHWDYNMQQAVWGAFSSNHLEQTSAYNEAALALLPTAEADARETYGIDGAKFFLTSYPRKHPTNPMPLLHYDKMMSIDGWVAHPMWWRYLYGQDRSYLRTQAYPLMRKCAEFYEGYLTRGSDGKYDIWPTAAWDIDFTPHLKDNRSFPMDLSFIRYLMNACVSASEILGVDQAKRETWRSIARDLREYPTGDTPGGRVFTAYAGSTSSYHFPLAAMMVFPGDDIGLDSRRDLLDTARRTVEPMTYSGDEQLLKAVIRARLGVDDIDAFERQLRAMTRPNGTLSYPGQWFFWVHGAGNSVWHNENLLQSYNGKIRIAPVKLKTAARFAHLRAVGAFLVSAEIGPGGDVAYVAVTSEAGRRCTLARPWEGGIRVRSLPGMEPVKSTIGGDSISFDTERGTTYVVDRPSRPWEKQPIVRIPLIDSEGGTGAPP